MAFATISGGGAFTKKNISDINSNFSALFAGLTPGNIIYCNPGATGAATQDGSLQHPYTSLATAYSATRNGKNDVVLLVGDGSTGATARQTASLTWSNNATHLIGICSPTLVSQRARIAPTSTATAYTPFITISGNGCIFANVQFFMGFTTGTTNQIGVLLTGSRNVFVNCHLAGLADAASAADAGSRTLKLGGSGAGENLFENCTIGVDTVTRSDANASVEFYGNAVRNVFRDCYFPLMTSAATPLAYIGSAAACIDRFNSFERCMFVNAIKSTSTVMDGLGTLAASAGGLLLFNRSVLVGVTEYGTDATTRGQCYVDGLTGVNSTSGIAVNPT